LGFYAHVGELSKVLVEGGHRCVNRRQFCQLRHVSCHTRITVELILRKLAEGTSEGDLLEDYPHFTTEGVRAALAYGAASVAHEEVVLLPSEPLASKS
jgi:hypothetical protein